jgi:hypothetical protein
MLLDEDVEPVTRREPLSRRREPELLGHVLAEVVLEIFRRRIEIAEAELAREDERSACHAAFLKAE